MIKMIPMPQNIEELLFFIFYGERFLAGGNG